MPEGIAACTTITRFRSVENGSSFAITKKHTGNTPRRSTHAPSVTRRSTSSCGRPRYSISVAPISSSPRGIAQSALM
jgi:hypothetical protein